MYVAVVREKGRARYELRRTVPLGGGLGFETVADLGADPGSMVRFGRFGICYAEELLAALAGFDADMDRMDEAFSRFAPQGYTGFSARAGSWRRTTPTLAQLGEIGTLHAFDRRRMAFLRSGEVNLSRIGEVNPRLFKGLVGKSRDELEQMFLCMERELPRDETRAYVHATFNLQRHFASLVARTNPEALDQGRLDEAFMLEYCALVEDDAFGFGLPGGAQAYLRRYACMHFDCDFPAADGFRRIFEAFMNDFRRHRPRPKPVAPERVRELFGLDMAEIRKLTRREFARVFRKKAMSMHPDKGGDHDAFVELLETYKRIVRGKSEG
jgi:hypothetical protein